jgi:16S rRNA (guanine527-N7)-methyltransferase
MNPDTEGQLRALIDEVLRVNQQFNLTAIRDPEQAWTKHILDSLQGLETSLFDEKKNMIDVGTGAGFPGLPLAITRPDLKVTLLEATRKKCDFLQNTVTKFELNAKVLNERAEAAGQNKVWRERFALATIRAVGSISEVCELTLPFVKVGGHAILWRGQWAGGETKAARTVIKSLGGSVQSIFPYQLESHPLQFHLVVIEKSAPTPKQFPRREGLPKHQLLCEFQPPENSDS